MKEDTQSKTALDIHFSNINYKVQAGSKTILHNVSGQFRAGHLSAIMGTSGAGKSSLMDILIGYRSVGVTGDILINGRCRDVRIFHKMSCYIQQENLVQTNLTVIETMKVAAALKIKTTPDRAKKVVEEILSTLGLMECRNTRTERLSGGQRKRLSIALELVSNPPVMFLDEPTTGLDVVAVSQCMQLLRSLALQGRTIVCTIHQPSASLFSLFHHVYVLAEGRCVYQGSPHQLVHFLDSLNFPCPTHYNPADFVLELVHDDEATVSCMSATIKNGEMNLQDEPSSCRDLHTQDVMDARAKFATSGTRQFFTLVKRMLLQQSRSKVALIYHTSSYLILALMYGVLFNVIGSQAHDVPDAARMILSIPLMWLFLSSLPSALIFPQRVGHLKREYFNRWYGLRPYFMAVTVSTLPMQVPLCIVSSSIIYWMVDLPHELYRYLLFVSTTVLVVMVSESLGFLSGVIFNARLSCVAVSTVSAVLALLSYFGVAHGQLMTNYEIFISRLSYLRYALTIYLNALYGLDRPQLECSQIFCIYRFPGYVVHQMGMEDASLVLQFAFLVGNYVLFRGLAFCVLRWRLKMEISDSGRRIQKFLRRLNLADD